jgi:hypothetical protein
MIANWLSTVEQRLAEGDLEDLAVALVSLAYVAGAEIEIPDDERRGATRRALLLLAAGGDPGRGLDLEGRAVQAVASDLDTPERREALAIGLTRLVGPASSLPHVREAVRGLRDEPDVAWRAYAASILGEDL